MMFTNIMYNRQDVYHINERERERETERKRERWGESYNSCSYLQIIFQRVHVHTTASLVYLQTASIQSSLFISIPSSSQFPQALARCNRAAMCTTRIDVKEKISRLVYLCKLLLSRTPPWSSVVPLSLVVTNSIHFGTFDHAFKSVSEAPRILPVLSPWIACGTAHTAHNTKTEEILI